MLIRDQFTSGVRLLVARRFQLNSVMWAEEKYAILLNGRPTRGYIYNRYRKSRSLSLLLMKLLLEVLHFALSRTTLAG